jgi:hypothetical protein
MKIRYITLIVSLLLLMTFSVYAQESTCWTSTEGFIDNFYRLEMFQTGTRGQSIRRILNILHGTHSGPCTREWTNWKRNKNTAK